MVDALHAIDGLIYMKMQLWDNAQLMTLQITHFEADFGLVFLYALQHGCRCLWSSGKYTKVHVRDGQIGRYTYFADRDERTVQAACEAKEDVTQILLDKTRYFLLSCRLHDDYGG